MPNCYNKTVLMEISMSDYRVEQEVHPKALSGRSGIVQGVLVRAYGQPTIYEVQWANDNGDINSKWFTASELD